MKQTAVEWLIEHLLDNGVGIHKKVRETALELEQIQKMELLNVSKGSDEKVISEAHTNITRRKGKEYAPTSNEIQAEIEKSEKPINLTSSQTAVEWLYDKWSNCKEWKWEEIEQWFEQAKEMERKQHSKTWDKALDAFESRGHNYVRAWEDFDEHFKQFSLYEHKETITSADIITSSQTEISDDEMIQAAIKHSEIYTLKFIPRSSFIDGAKWYREQLKKKQ